MESRILIVGGGPVGLSLALGLAHHGVRSVVVERERVPLEQSRALVIWPRTAEVLRAWGAWDALRAAGQFTRTVGAVDARNERPLAGIDFTHIADLVEDPGVLILPQYETERVLRELVAANPLCNLRLGCESLEVMQDAHGVVLRIGEGGSETALRAPYLAGCDGARGMVRHSLGLQLDGETYPTRIILSDERFEPAPMLKSPRIRPDLAGMLGAIEYAPDHWRIIASIDGHTSDEDAMLPAAHAIRIRQLFGENLRSETLWRSLFRIHRRHAPRFVVGRVALAGDAAHLNSPAGGQGMNAGIQDAANLAWKFALALGHPQMAPTLLESYDLERREMVSDTIERFTDRLTRVGTGFPAIAKKLGLRLLARSTKGDGMQCKLARGVGMLSGRYTKSPLIDAGHPLAGRRIPDLLLADGRRLNAHRRGCAALLFVGATGLAEFDAIAIPRAPKRWHLKRPTAFVIRPDDCVAAVIEKPTRKRVLAAWERAFAGAIPPPLRAMTTKVGRS